MPLKGFPNWGRHGGAGVPVKVRHTGIQLQEFLGALRSTESKRTSFLSSYRRVRRLDQWATLPQPAAMPSRTSPTAFALLGEGRVIHDQHRVSTPTNC